MKNISIIPITEHYIEGFRSAVDSVAREKKYLAFLEAPSLEISRAFVLENIRDNWPHFVALDRDKVIGWCDITSLHRDIYSHVGVLGIGVISEYRGKGIGKSLIYKAIENAKSIGLTRIELTVREKNEPAIVLYEKIGFIKEGFHKNAVRIDNKYENHISMALLF